MNLRSRFAASLVTLGLLGGLTVAVSAPAQAEAKECRSNSRSFSLPNQPDVDVLINLCIYRSTTYARASATIEWTGSLGVIGGTRFNDFIVHTNIERYDVIKDSDVCNITTGINSYYNGTRGCYVERYNVASGGWSADGHVIFDIEGDGTGNFRWDLYGSPVIP